MECHQRSMLKGPPYIINYQKVRSIMPFLLMDPAFLWGSIGDGKQLCVGVPYKSQEVLRKKVN